MASQNFLAPLDYDRSPANAKNPDAGLAPLLLTITELVRQLMEAQVIRRMESGVLNDEELNRAAESLRRLEAEIVPLCEVLTLILQISTLIWETWGHYYPKAKATILVKCPRLLRY